MARTNTHANDLQLARRYEAAFVAAKGVEKAVTVEVTSPGYFRISGYRGLETRDTLLKFSELLEGQVASKRAAVAELPVVCPNCGEDPGVPLVARTDALRYIAPQAFTCKHCGTGLHLVPTVSFALHQRATA